ncbi:MAG: hypothetical protein JWO53_957, partial [Chlamydiia bacterium]|nr:hypothetical protein [Chlamydiia bacterium]
CVALGDDAFNTVVEQFPKIKELYISDATASDSVFKQLSKLTDLRYLAIEGVEKTTDVAWNSLTRCKKLEKIVVLQGEAFTDEMLLSLMPATQVKFISINRGTGLSNSALQDFKKFRNGCDLYVKLEILETTTQKTIDAFTEVEERKEEKKYPTPTIPSPSGSDAAIFKDRERTILLPASIKSIPDLYSSGFFQYIAHPPIRQIEELPDLIFARLLTYLSPSTLFFTQKSVQMECKDIIQLLSTNKQFAKYIKIFLRATHNVAPLQALARKNTPFLNGEELFTTTLAKNTQLLDIRKMASGSHLKAWMEILLDRYPNASQLHLPSCTIDEELGKILGQMENLSILDVALVDKTNLSGWRYLTSLTTLSNRTHYETINALWNERIHLHAQQVTMDELQPLVRDSLTNTLFTDEAVQIISQMHNLTSIDLGNSEHITDDALLHLGNMPNLTHLALANSSITIQGIRNLANCKNLEMLNIAKCKNLTDAAFRLIARQFPKLRELYCSENDISDLGLRTLTTMTHLDTLVMGLQRKLTDAGWKQILQMKQLKKLLVTQNQCMSRGTILACTQLPHLKIFHLISPKDVETKLALQLIKPDCEVLYTHNVV